MQWKTCLWCPACQAQNLYWQHSRQQWKVSQHILLDFGDSLESVQVEQLAISSISDVNSLIIVPEGICQHDREHAEEGGSQHTFLFDPIRNRKGIRAVAVSRTLADIPSRNCLTTVMNLLGIQISPWEYYNEAMYCIMILLWGHWVNTDDSSASAWHWSQPPWSLSPLCIHCYLNNYT